MPRTRRRNLRAALLPRVARLSRLVPLPAVRAARPVVAAALGAVPGWRRDVECGMRAALGPEGVRREHVRAYFTHVANLLASAAILNRVDYPDSGIGGQWTLAPEAREIYIQALAPGKGAVMLCPHLTGHELAAAAIARPAGARGIDISVMTRKSPEAEYEALKQRWYRAVGVNAVNRPHGPAAEQGLAMMTAALRVLRRGGILAIAPDLPQRAGTGVPVRLFGRSVELPSGPFFLGCRTGAPLLPSFFHWNGSSYHLWSHPPIQVDPALDRDAAIADAAQRWTSLFEAFLREHPDMWQFWLDKRWRRWLQAER